MKKYTVALPPDEEKTCRAIISRGQNILAWETRRNTIRKPFNWTFTVEDAHAVFRDSYSSTLLN